MKLKYILIIAGLLFMGLLVLLYSINFGTLEARTLPRGVDAEINAKVYNSSSPIKLRPGKYNVLLKKDGYQSYLIKNVRIEAFKNTVISRKLATTAEAELQKELPYDDGLTFKIELRDDGEKYIYDIGLYAILNRPDQLEGYKGQVAQFKKDALGYISSFGVNPENIEINWLQEEAR